MPVSIAFKKAYRSLNPEQKKAVDAIEGPVMVIAGPGTGKTRILTLRVANILAHTDTQPEQILALTFTESGVTAIRNRLGEIIGPAAWRTRIYTFHSFANAIIRRHPDAFPRIIGSEPMTLPERVEILKSLLETLPLKHLRPFNNPLFYLPRVGTAVSDLKRENIRPNDLRRLCDEQEKSFRNISDLYHTKGVHEGKMKGVYEGRQKKLKKNRDLLLLYTQYEKSLKKQRKYDFEDMILEVVGGFQRNKTLLREVAEEYQYILADEHQDANAAQNALLELLISLDDNPNLFIVGDEKQAIFRFQGASLDNFLYFKRRYPKSLIIPLTKNYRSTQPILDAAHSLMGNAPKEETLRIPLHAQHEKTGRKIALAEFTTPEFERAYIAREVATCIQSGVPAQEIAVLFRTNQEGERIRRALQKEGVRAILESERDALKDEHVRAYCALLRLLAHFGDDTFLPEVLHIPSLSISPLDLYRFLSFSSRERFPLWTVLKTKNLLQSAGVENMGTFVALYEQLLRWHTLSKKENLLIWTERIFRESGLLEDAINGTGRDEALGAIRAVFSGTQELLARNHNAHLHELVEWLSLFEQHTLPLYSDVPAVEENKVRLMTAHKAKGLEFKEVFVIGVNDRIWGNRRDTDHFYLPRVLGGAHDLDDERRLFYVAITRAKAHVTVSWSRQSESGRETTPSVFIQEIDTNLVDRVDTTSFESSFDITSLFREPMSERPTDEEHLFLRNLFLEQGLAVTGLNNYLECPWRYFYLNLLRVPKVQENSLLFGSAIHEALRYFFEAWRKGKNIGVKALVRRFRGHVEKQPLSNVELRDMKRRGEKALRGWYKRYRGMWPREGMSEFSIVVDFPLGREKITLRGKLDRIDLIDNRAVVVDYKTGRTKSRREIEGKTRRSDGGYKRQLVFYKLLLEKFDAGRYRMDEGVLDFIEPDERGKYHQERFSITYMEVKELEKIIAEVGHEILNLDFWDKVCDDKKCEYCRLRRKLTNQQQKI